MCRPDSNPISIEQTVERQTSLYLNLIFFEKAFAGINHNILLDILMHYGIPWKINNIYIHYYTKTSPIKLHRGTMTDSYPVTTGVIKGCLLFPLVFITLLNWISKTTNKDPKDIRWTISSLLESHEFADDFCTDLKKQQVYNIESTRKRIFLLIN